MKNLAIIQARCGSKRLPRKVLLPLGERTVLECVVDRVKKSNLVDFVMVATTLEKEDIPIVELCKANSIYVYCGSTDDVLDRYYQAAKQLKPDNVIRVTADCPLLDPKVLDLVIKTHMITNADYTSNTIEVTYPDGLDCEIMKYTVLEEIWKKAKLASQREHVTQFIIQSDMYKKKCVKNKIDYSKERWTLDTSEDYQLLTEIYKILNEDETDFETVMELLNQESELRKLNEQFERNEGLAKSLMNDYKIK